MIFKNNPKKEKWFAYTVATCSAVALYIFLSNLGVFIGWIRSFFSVLSPVIEGIVFAYMLNPLCVFLERTIFKRIKKKRLSRVMSVGVGALIVFLLIIVMIVAIMPQIGESLYTLASNIGNYSDKIKDIFDDLEKYSQDMELDEYVSSYIMEGNKAISKTISSLPEQIKEVLEASYNISMSVANIVLAFVLAIYFLLDQNNLLAGVNKFARALFSKKRYEALTEFWGRCNKILIRYITFDIVDGIIVGIANFFFMLAFRMPYSVLISVVVGLTNLAPTFGPIAGGAFGAFILFFSDPAEALTFVLFTLIIQTLDAYLIKPKLFGSSLGVPAVWILITIIVGGNLFGILGILLAIPFAAIMTYVYRNFIENQLDAKRIQRDEAEESEQS